ncbi:MAG: methylmalonyl-CoA decarboxylase [Acidimicrobiales bacterium]
MTKHDPDRQLDAARASRPAEVRQRAGDDPEATPVAETAAFLSSAEDGVVAEAVDELERRQHLHYQASTRRERQGYLRDLFKLVVRCVDEADVEPIVESSQRIAADRFAAGFDIAEIQGAFNVLEEVLWREVAEGITGEGRIEALGLLNAILGAGRDALARTYVALAGQGADPGGEASAPRRSAVAARAGTPPPGVPAPAQQAVRTEIQGRVGIVTLDDPRKRNALSAQLASSVTGALASLRAEDVRAVVLRAAAGLNVWSSGHDIDELPRGRRDPLAYNDPLEQLLRAIRSFPAPVLAMVHGAVWGGAFDLVLSCDVVVADESATFAITPANLGLPYNTTGLLHFLGRLPINLTKEMFFTAAPLDAQKAKEWLVINHLVPSDELERFTLELAATMATKSPLAIAVIKEQLRVLTDYQPIAAQVYERIQGLRREVYDSSDYLEGLKAFSEKRAPKFRGT